MKPNIKKVIEKAKAEFINALKDQYSGPISRDQGHEIQQMFHNYRKQKEAQFYKKERDLKHISRDIKELILSIQKRGKDSKAEMIFWEMLEGNNIPFEFQYKIGPYKADFFIKPALVVEIDGPHHNNQKEHDLKRNQYMEKMGYTVFRVPIYLLSMQEKAIIDEIQEYMKS